MLGIVVGLILGMITAYAIDQLPKIHLPWPVWVVVSVACAVAGGLIQSAGASPGPRPSPQTTVTVPSATSPDEEPSPDRELSATDITSIKVTFDDVVSVSVGKKVGPTKWQLEDWGGVPTARISVAWQSRTADNLEVESDTCEALITLRGPTDLPSHRSDECSQDHKSGFREDSVTFEVLHTGTYTVTVEDAVSGSTGLGTFTVVS